MCRRNGIYPNKRKKKEEKKKMLKSVSSLTCLPCATSYAIDSQAINLRFTVAQNIFPKIIYALRTDFAYHAHCSSREHHCIRNTYKLCIYAGDFCCLKPVPVYKWNWNMWVFGTFNIVPELFSLSPDHIFANEMKKKKQKRKTICYAWKHRVQVVTCSRKLFQ